MRLKPAAFALLAALALTACDEEAASIFRISTVHAGEAAHLRHLLVPSTREKLKISDLPTVPTRRIPSSFIHSSIASDSPVKIYVMSISGRLRYGGVVGATNCQSSTRPHYHLQ